MYEYKVYFLHNVSLDGTGDKITEAINRIAKDGWKLVSTNTNRNDFGNIDDFVLFFERTRQD